MAYSTRYTFSFDSPEGKEIDITIAENGYTGDAVNRPLGGSPLLRMDSSGSIKGMSLEIPAECQVEDEYADLYTSDPTKFLVTLSINSADAWFGFISPEIYAAPWVDPPYDVALTATDGLGELKRYTYEARGLHTLSDHLTFLLAKTGLTLPVRFVSKLTNNETTYDYFLVDTAVSMDHMAGETCYDVLQAILDSIHATIRQRGGNWLLIRETDVADCVSGSNVVTTYGSTVPIVPFGSMRTENVWPVGRLTSEIVPARNAAVVNCDNQPSGNLLPDGDMSSGTWSGDGTYDSTNAQYIMSTGKYIYRNAALPEMISGSTNPNISLSVRARQSDAAAAHNVKIRVKAYGQRVNLTTMATYYLADDSINTPGEPYWSDTEKYISKELKAASYGNASDFEKVTIGIPFARLSSYYINPISYLEIRIESDDSTVYVDSAELISIAPYDGVETTVNLNNGARGADNTVGIEFADTYGFYKGVSWASNALWYPRSGGDYLIETFASPRISACRTGQFLGQDYALSVANPRLSIKGILHLPVGILPPVFISNDGITFLVQEFSYDLLQDEMDLSVISLPAATITVTSIEQTVVYGETGSSSSGSGSGGSGGGGGATSLANLTDVDITTVPPTSGNGLIYDGTSQMWVPGSVGSGGTGNVFFGTCPNASETAAKVVTATGFASTDLQEGTILHVLFSYGSSASSPTLNVNNTGAVAITHAETTQYMWANNTTASFVYYNNSWRLFGNYAFTNRYGKVMLVTSISSLYAQRTTQNRYALTPQLGWDLFLKSLRSPDVRILRGYDSRGTALTPSIVATHPIKNAVWITGSFCLMTYSKKKSKKVASHKDKVRSGWGEALGDRRNTPYPLTFDRTVSLDAVRARIIKNYVKKANGTGYTGTDSAVMTAFRQNGGTFGHGTHAKRKRLFGIAFRMVNPAFADPSGAVDSCRMDANGNPRYIYSEVAPIMVWINQWTDSGGTTLNVMGFQLAPYKGG